MTIYLQDKAVVTALYQQILEREPDPDGLEAWTRLLMNASLTTRGVVRSFLNSAEYTSRFVAGRRPDEVVAFLYKHVLVRDPDPAGARGWPVVLSNSGYGAVVDGIVNSAEYTQRWGEMGVPGHPELQARRDFPMHFHREDDFGSFHMITDVIVSNNGRFDARTETHNHVAVKGNCGTVAVWLFDAAGNVLDRRGGDQFCVDGSITSIFSSPSVRTDAWGFNIDPNTLGQIANVSILHGEGHKDVLALVEENLSRAKQIVQTAGG